MDHCLSSLKLLSTVFFNISSKSTVSSFQDFDMNEFDATDFRIEHLALLEEINGQWLDETKNLTLWLSQACYTTSHCLVTGQCM
jgi:hypothetical protein